jgi:hypothetical protein
MAYYDALIAAWNAGGKPVNTSGTSIVGGMTTAQKIDAVNSWTMTGTQQSVIVPTYQIYNAIVPADFTSLSASNQQLVRDILGMGTVDASPGTNVRATLVSVFTGKATTLANFQALADSYKPSIPWWQQTVANGGGGLASAVNANDAAAAGLS